jgi:hypothetical protein
VNTTAGATVNVRLTQVTVGIVSTVMVSFGDGSANQTFTAFQAGSPVNISHNYTASGSFVISATANANGLTGVNTTVNEITVYVFPAPVYKCKKRKFHIINFKLFLTNTKGNANFSERSLFYNGLFVGHFRCNKRS